MHKKYVPGGTPQKKRRFRELQPPRSMQGRAFNRQIQRAVLQVHTYFLRERMNNGPLISLQKVRLVLFNICYNSKLKI